MTFLVLFATDLTSQDELLLKVSEIGAPGTTGSLLLLMAESPGNDEKQTPPSTPPSGSLRGGASRRMADMPGPRKATGLMGPLLGRILASPYRFALAGLYGAGVLPWHLSVLSLTGNAVVGWLLLTGRRVLPAGLLLVAGLMDVFDGGVARLRGEASRAGAFLDSVLDRASDLIVFGCLFWSLAGQGRVVAAAFALTTLVVSLLVSHVRAEGEALGLHMSEGLFQRLERYVALTVGLIVPGALLPVLVLLTALGGVTVAQRSAMAWRGLQPRR